MDYPPVIMVRTENWEKLGSRGVKAKRYGTGGDLRLEK